MIRQTGKGVGSARKQGVEESKGEFICFVDSDDWVRPNYVEDLYNCLTSDGSDYVECDYSYGENGDERLGGNSLYSKLGRDLIRSYGAPACWKQMYRKSFWIDNGIGFTNSIAEDLFLYSDIYGVSNNYSFLQEPLYCYRIRNGSMFHTDLKNAEKYRELLELFERIVSRYSERGLFEESSDVLYRMFMQHSCMHFRSVSVGIDNKYAAALRRVSSAFFEKHFKKNNDPFKRKVVALGGYNLGRIANNLSPDRIEDIRYCFSSIISIMSPKTETEICFSNRIPYRQNMLEKDVKGSFVSLVTCDNVDVLLIDFLEERFDIIKYRDSYYTKSEAIENMSIDQTEISVIPRLTKKCDELWENACDRFIDLVNKLDNRCEVILLESYLSEHVGNIYSRQKKIDDNTRMINDKLRQYYDYFERNCSRIVIINELEIPYYLKYTDEFFEHGVLPEHQNKYYYSYVANKIMDYI